jgi:hypothetical protein
MYRMRLAVLGLLLATLSGCASSTPATPLTAIDPLVGKWKGTATIGPIVTVLYLTVYPDRTLVAIWGSTTSRGTVTISGGQAGYEMGPPRQEGTLRFYAGPGKPQLYMESMSGSFYATLERDS